MNTQVAIVESGRIVRHVGAETVVPWWSFTKTLIAAAALALARDRALRLDDRLPGRPYSLRLLLQHRAGLADYGDLRTYHDAVSRDETAWPWQILMRAVDAGRLRFEPGRGWGYSNIGYLIARRHLEALCGENLNALLRRLVFDPLEIAGPRLAMTRGDLDGVTLGSINSYDPQWVYHGLVVGTLHDAALLLHRLLTTDFLPAGLLAEMTGGWPVGGALEGRPWRTTAYGLGVMTGTGPGNARVIGHTGGGPGSVIAVYHRPDATPSVTTAAFSCGEDAGRVEAEAFALRP
ncbi:MAG: serine hydrolase domain-containing protein [Bradyrhizobium sp.]|nr:serine hydrolase domain-containing protein [Bradyrhizobium sp.]